VEALKGKDDDDDGVREAGGERTGRMHETKIVTISNVYPEHRTECLIRGYVFLIFSSRHLFVIQYYLE
jgi:hypothetical protein